MLKYLDYEDELMLLKTVLREVERGVIPWSEEPQPVEKLEDWEDDLFD
jgi:hypothetical protein